MYIYLYIDNDIDVNIDIGMFQYLGLLGAAWGRINFFVFFYMQSSLH